MASVLVSDASGDALAPWRCYLCNLNVAASQLATAATFSPADSYRVRAYLEPIGTLLTALAGTISGVAVDLTGRTANVTFAASTANPVPYSSLWLRVDKKTPAGVRPGSAFAVTDAGTGAACPLVRGAYQVTPVGGGAAATTVRVTWSA